METRSTEERHWSGENGGGGGKIEEKGGVVRNWIRKRIQLLLGVVALYM
jgi:hypothetical protein